MVDKAGKRTNALIIAMLMFMYAAVAMSDNFKGIFVPAFKEEFGVSNTSIGYLMTVSLLGYALFQYVGGILIERLGYKKTILAGGCLGIAALLLIVFSTGYPMLLAGMFLLHAGMALFSVTVSTLGPALTVASTAVLMNLLVAGYSASNTALQKVSGILLERGVPWTSFYLFMAACLVVLLIFLAPLKVPYEPQVSAQASGKNRKALLKNKMLYLYILAAAFYLGSEYGIGAWFPNYMSEVFELRADARGTYLTANVGIRTLSLLLGGFVADRLGQYRSIILYAGIGAALLAAGVALGHPGLWVISASGFAFAVIFPGIITTIKDVFRESTSYATGLILMGGILGAMCISALMGALNDVIGARTAFYLMPLCMLLTLVATLFIRHYANDPRIARRAPE